MKTHHEQPSTSAVGGASQPGTPVSAHGQALEETRAQFRAAWQAKQERAERIRAHARNVDKVLTWSARIGLLIVYVSACVLALGLGKRVGFWEVVRTAPYLPLVRSYLGCSLICVCAWVLRGCLQRSADRLQAAEVWYP